METVMKYVEPYMKYVTPYNVSLGVNGLLIMAGIGHGLPGKICQAQMKIFKFPGWFIICAGLLMLGTGIGSFVLPSLSIYFVSMVIGGTVTTGIVMPSPLAQKPGGVIFSLSTLAAAVWVHYKNYGLTIVDVLICKATFACGVAGVVFLPTNQKINKMVKGATKSDVKKEGTAAASSSSQKSGNVSSTAAGSKKGSNRTQSPGATARTSQ